MDEEGWTRTTRAGARAEREGTHGYGQGQSCGLSTQARLDGHV